MGKEDVLNPHYWSDRYNKYFNVHPSFSHHSIFRCPLDQWLMIQAKHTDILRDMIGDHRGSILDVGCGYGRMFPMLLRAGFRGTYVGVDLGVEFIHEAVKAAKTSWAPLMGQLETTPTFICADILTMDDPRNLLTASPNTGNIRYDWAILCGVRPMIRRNAGEGTWRRMRERIAGWCKKALYMEYDKDDPGDVEIFDAPES